MLNLLKILKMKKLKKLITAVVMMIAIIAVFQSCKKSAAPVDYNSNKTNLSLEIDTATSLYTVAVEGKQAGDYTAGSRAALKVAIDLANSVKGGSFTQYQVNNAQGNLMRALTQFKNKLIQEISSVNLVAHWKLNGDATDASGNGHNGQLKTGWIGNSAATATDGATLPVLVADRYGAANKAYDFNNGAYVEVPYDPTLHPSSFTLCAWVKIHATNAGNYMISLDRWNGYKFQLQSNNFPYLTIFTDNGYLDVDDNPGTVPLEKWTQVIASYTTGAMKFYINGVLIKTVAKTGNPAALPSPINLSIGNELPKSDYNFTDSSNPNYFWGANYLIGSLSDVRIYNKVLSDAEANSLYVMESPN
jgi:hypothetical protein